MSRDYWFTYSVELEENAERRQTGQEIREHGIGFGKRFSFTDDDGTLLSEEQVRQIAKDAASILETHLLSLRAREQARRQKTAAPFWKKWLGG